MDEQNLAKILEILEPYFRKKFEKEENSIKTAKMVNAVIADEKPFPQDVTRIKVYLVGDTSDNTSKSKTIFIVTNPNPSITYKKGDIVQLIYYDSLRNAKIFAKN